MPTKSNAEKLSNLEIEMMEIKLKYKYLKAIMPIKKRGKIINIDDGIRRPKKK